MWENHQGASLRAAPRASPNRSGHGPGAAGRRLGRVPGPPLRWAHERHPEQQPPHPPGLRPDRRDRRVRDAQGRCQGQGPQGRGPSGDRLRRRGAGLPDPRLRRRGGGRRLPRPEEPPLHARPAACPSSRRRSPRRRCATAAYEVSTRPRSWSPTAASRRSTRRSPTMLDPDDEVIVPGAVLDDVPRGDPARRRRRGRGARRRDPGLQGHRRAARGGAHREAPRCCCSSPPRTPPARSTRPTRSARSAAGSRTTTCGC